jgi:hypothetical protein
VPSRGIDSSDGDLGRGFRKAAENAAGVKPADSMLSEDTVPVDFAGLQLGNGCVAAIVTSKGGAYAEATLGEIKAVSRCVAYAIVFDPADQRLVYAALINKILKQPADGIIGEDRDDGGVQAETALQSARYVVFAATFADFEGTRGGDGAVAGVKAEHDFTETDDVPAAIFFRFDGQAHAFTSTAQSMAINGQSIVTVLAKKFQNRVFNFH